MNDFLFYSFQGRKDDHLGRVHDQQRARHHHADDVGNGMRLLADREPGCLRVNHKTRRFRHSRIAFLPTQKGWHLQSSSSLGRGLDNKITVYPLSLEEDSSGKKKTVGVHSSYMSCCLFPNSDQQVNFLVLQIWNKKYQKSRYSFVNKSIWLQYFVDWWKCHTGQAYSLDVIVCLLSQRGYHRHCLKRRSQNLSIDNENSWYLPRYFFIFVSIVQVFIDTSQFTFTNILPPTQETLKCTQEWWPFICQFWCQCSAEKAWIGNHQ